MKLNVLALLCVLNLLPFFIQTVAADPPIASFTYTLNTCGTLQFTDTSTEMPINWLWHFVVTSGDIVLNNQLSSMQHPKLGVVAGNTGTIEASLDISNLDGTDSYETIIPITIDWNTCCIQSFTDTGGTLDNYQGDEVEIWTFCPDGAVDDETVTITFTEFDVEFFFDQLFVFNGFNQFSPLIGVFSGSGLENAPGEGTITSTATSGCLTFIFTSDTSIESQGWEATVSYTCTECTVSISNVTSEGCYYDPMTGLINTVFNVNVWWSNAPANETIIVETLGNTQTINTNNVDPPVNIQLVGAVSEWNNNIITASFSNNSCDNSDVVTYDASAGLDCHLLSCGDTLSYINVNADGSLAENNVTWFICPDNNLITPMTINFTDFNVGNFVPPTNCENEINLEIFDGFNTDAPSLGVFCGETLNNLPNDGTISATNSSGCLTMVLNANEPWEFSGLEAEVACEFCALNINNITVDACTYEPGATTTMSELTIELEWINPPNNETIELTINGTTYTYIINTTTDNGQAIVQLTVPTNLGGPNVVNASFSTTNCFDLNGELFYSDQSCLALQCDEVFEYATPNPIVLVDTLTWLVCAEDNSNALPTVSFEDFNIGNCENYMLVFDGISTNAPSLGSFCGTTLDNAPGAGVISATNSSACLTFAFVQNELTNVNWNANITCNTVLGANKPLAQTAELIVNTSPNPLRQQATIYFSVPITSNATVNLYNANGQYVNKLFEATVTGKTTNSFVFDASNVVAGIYFVQVNTSNGLSTYQKVIVTN